MTDSDVIKGLDACANKLSCRKCPYDRLKIMECSQTMMRDAIALIKRQHEELERLTEEKDNLIRNYKECAMEVVRDFAERIKATFPPRDKCTLDDCYTLDKIDEIVAEMEGEK